MKGKKKAYLTLEATWMFGLALLIFIGVLLLTISLYGETYKEISDRKPPEINAVSEFRKIAVAKDMAEKITDKGDKKEE
ncbi:hypothetical protein [Candidatus Weimeria sp. HCP3S3_B5]|uniref:hypothetical protein n=1 Tax=Candidatus Weimeria sp. HCP3S3_B5 TaxID=3438871 RepID=UPI00304020CF|nr:hypothetical protein [Lachnospiraceae bacterium]